MTRARALRQHASRQLRRVPRAAWACALVAMLNGAAWAALVPPFHVPDENSHLAYVQYLSETGHLPVHTQGQPFSSDENAALSAVGFYNVIGQPGNRPPLTKAQTATLRATSVAPWSRINPNADNATDNPPLYYLLASIPYKLSPSKKLIDRLAVIRLLSAVLAAVTALAVVLFLRELLPSAPWTWPIGGMMAALQPMFGFMSGGVSVDSLIYALSALTILATARCLRRGLTPARGAFLGLVVVAGVLTKPAYYGLVPGVAVGLLACLVQGRATGRRLAVRGLAAAAVLIAAVLGFYWVLTNTVLERSAYAGVTTEPLRGGNTFEQVSYMWQLFFPRLPWMTDWLPGFPLRDLWNNEFTGRFGWLDYGYPGWVYNVTWWVTIVAGVLAIVALIRHRRRVWRRVLELVTYVAFVLGVLFSIAWADFYAKVGHGQLFEQGRYLLPLLPLWAGLFVVALHGLGRRLGRPLGAVLVVGVLALSLFGQLLTMARFYG